ncbi:hsp70 nucleotide exchange factor FES1-like isoform X2 [Silene latifolia]|uniref:hsp70 nucleotide exchange factor FES1-like isoform X2 n=1 Tax=Silene latifolia TaxID=37657 RepID=UPI003D774EF9
MGCVRLSLVLFIAIVISAMTVFGNDARVNKSTSRLFWSTGKEDGDLVRKADSEESVGLSENDELDGGFSSLDGMLQWAIGHSDPAKLKEIAQNVQRLSHDELKKRQIEIQELMEKLKMPSDAELMKIAINDLNNSSTSREDRLRALEELLLLVEPIDNANDFGKLGGLAAVVKQLDHVDPDVRKLAAWVLGKANQNNPTVQQQVLELGTLGKLIKMVKSDFAEEAIKALYAVSAIIRNNFSAQETFYAEGGDLMLKDILSNSAVDVRLRRRCVFLVGDLAESQLENKRKATLPFFSDHVFLKAVIDLTSSDDLDLQEKALIAIKSLLQLKSTGASVFKELCGLDEALVNMRRQLQQVMEDESRRDYAEDVEILRQEVELMFDNKLDKGAQVPT